MQRGRTVADGGAEIGGLLTAGLTQPKTNQATFVFFGALAVK
jgi:hypothetical protein